MMRKNVLTAIVLMFSAMIFVAAQEAPKFGLKGGLNMSNLSGDDFEEADSRIGFHAGAFANFRLSEQIALQPEVLYSAQGVKYEESGEELGVPYSVESKMNLDYINVPLMLKWYAYEGFNVEFGPQVGLLIGAKLKNEGTVGGVTEEEEFDIKDDLETLDLGLNVGAGYEFDNNLSIGLRYGLGLTDIQEDADAKNSVFQVGVGYAF